MTHGVVVMHTLAQHGRLGMTRLPRLVGAVLAASILWKARQQRNSQQQTPAATAPTVPPASVDRQSCAGHKVATEIAANAGHGVGRWPWFLSALPVQLLLISVRSSATALHGFLLVMMTGVSLLGSWLHMKQV